jgi:mRNA capping enzyme, beta chain
MEAEHVFRFQATVLPEQHKLWNAKLNSLVTRQGGTSSSKTTSDALHVTYKHEKTWDCFYTHPSMGTLRATFEQQADNQNRTASGSRLKHVLQKTRIADLAILFPLLPFDVRLSINHERPGRILLFIIDQYSVIILLFI